MHWKYLIILTLLLAGCTEKEIIPEPEQPEPTSPPGDFSVSVSDITDTRVYISWTEAIDPDSKDIVYDIAFNDSVVVYDYSTKYYSGYYFDDLIPDHLYTVKVIARDDKRNETIRSTAFHTLKPFIRQVITYDLGYDNVRFQNSIETSDEGFFIQGEDLGAANGRADLHFFLKLDQNFQIEWLREKNFGLEPNALLEASDGSFYIVFSESVLKLDNTGNEAWEYLLPAEYNVYLKNITENYDGNLIIVGNSWVDKYNQSKEFFVSIITPDKEELWHKIGGGIYSDDGAAVIVEENHRIAVYGQNGTRGALFFMDQEGEFIREYTFDNQYNGEDVGVKFIRKYNDNYLLASSIGTYGGYDYVPHFMNINPDGQRLWDVYPDVSSSSFTTLRDVDDMGNGETLILTSSYDRETIAVITVNGETGPDFDLRNFPAGNLIKIDKNNDYVMITYYGQIIVFNHDGYFSNEYSGYGIYK